jgi:hypothetical protein
VGREISCNIGPVNEYEVSPVAQVRAQVQHSYGLDGRAIVVRYPAETKDFSSSVCVQTGSGAHPNSCIMGTGVPFLGAKARPGCDADHSPPSSAKVENEELYLLSPKRLLGV